MATNYEKSYYQTNSQSRGVSRITFIIVIITTIVVSFIVYQNIDNIKELFTSSGEEIVQENMLHIGDIVEFSGFIMDNGDVRIYSHTLETQDYGKIGLKSRTIKLDDYQGEVFVKGEIERLQGSLFILEVENIVGDKTALIDTGDDQSATYNSGKYFTQAGIYFPDEFFNQFELLNQGEGGKINVKNMGSTQELSIKYFTCDASNDSKNCDQLEKNFANAGEKSFQTVNGVIMYKLYEVESRFARSDYRGYFINDVNETEVASMVQYMQVVNDNLVDKIIKPNISKLCKVEGQVMENLTDYKLSKQGNEVIVSLHGSNDNGTMTCEVSLNPNLVRGGTFINANFEAKAINIGDKQEINISTGSEDGIIDLNDLNYNEQEENIEGTTEDAMANYDGEQFPINLQKTLTFESRRGHTIIFPSGNISYAGVNISSNLGEEGVNCFSQMNVVKYGTSEEDRDENPSIKIYECSIKNGFAGSSNYRLIDVGDNRHFIIETVDPARQNFADHVEIK